MLCANFVKFGWRKWVKSCVAYLTKKNEILPGSPAVTTALIAPRFCQVQPPTVYSECCRFHPNQFTFGGVMAECVNTAKTCRKMNPIFSCSLGSSQITSGGRGPKGYWLNQVHLENRELKQRFIVILIQLTLDYPKLVFLLSFLLP